MLEDIERKFADKFNFKKGIEILLSKYIYKNVSYLASSSIFIYGLNLLSLIVITRLVSKSDYGTVVLISSIINTFIIFGIPGFDTVITKDAAKDYDSTYLECVKQSLRWSFLVTPVLIVIGIYYYFYAENAGIAIALFIISTFIPFYFSSRKWEAFFSGKKEFGKLSLWRVIFLSGKWTAIGFLFLSRNIYIYVVLLHLFNTAIYVYYFFHSKRYANFSKKIPKNLQEGSIKYGYRLTKINFLNIIIREFDKLLIGFLIGPISLAGYNIARRLYDIITSLTKSSVQVPSVKLAQRSEPEYKKRLEKYFIFIFFLSCCSVIAFVSISPIFIKFLFPSYKESIFYFQLLSLSYVLAPIDMLIGKYLLFNQKPNEILFQETSANILKVILFILLFYLFGIIGIILTFIICNIYTFITSLLIFNKKLPFLEKMKVFK